MFTQPDVKGERGPGDSSRGDQTRESRGTVTQPPDHRKADPRAKKGLLPRSRDREVRGRGDVEAGV